MSQRESVLHALEQLFTVTQKRDGVSVRTQCLYPSNQFIQLTVRGGEDRFVVSDERGAVREVEAAGATLAKEDKLIAPVMRPMGLSVSKGIIRLETDARSLGIAVALVANASKAVAEYLYAHLKIRPMQNFKEPVYSYLRQSAQGPRDGLREAE